MNIQPTQPQSIGAVLDTSFQLYKVSLARVLPICLVAVLGSLPASLYPLLAPRGTPSAFDPTGTLSMMTRPSYLGLYLLTFLVSFWAYGALFFKQEAIATGSDVATSDVLRRSVGRVPSMFVSSILYFLAVFFGSFLLLVPGMLLSVSLLLAAPLVVVEGRGPFDALVGSHRLVWGNWWRTLAILSVGLFVLLVIYLTVVFAATLVPIATTQDPVMFSFISGLVLGLIVGLVVTPYYTALLLAIYWDLKLRKEGGDLAARVGALKAA